MRRHDRYVLRSFLAALATTILFLSMLVVVYDVAERIDKLPRVLGRLAEQGRSGAGLLVEYYLTLLPFLWLRILPVGCLIAAGLTFTWLGRQNELVPLVASGVPSRRILLPIFAAAAVLVVVQTVARETVVPGLSRRHDDLHRLFQDRGKQGRYPEVPHVQDLRGGRLSMAVYVPSERRMESAWITFRRAGPAGEPGDFALGYPSLVWDAGARGWRADRGGQRRALSGGGAGADVQAIPAGELAPLAVEPALLELTLRQSAALGLSSAEISELARANPDRSRFTLLLHQQWAQPVATIVLLMLGMPLLFHLGRGQVFRSFLRVLSVVGSYYMTDSVVTDMGARGALNPVVAAYATHIVFAALGVVMMTTLET